MSVLPIQIIPPGTPQQTALVVPDPAGDLFSNNGRVWFWMINETGINRSVKFKAQRKCSQGQLHDWEITVPAGGLVPIGPFDTYRFNNSLEQIEVSYPLGTATGMGVGVIQMQPAEDEAWA